MRKFDSKNKELTSQYENIRWLSESGLSSTELQSCFDELMKNDAGLSRAMIKAKTLEMLSEKSRIAIDTDDIFQEKLYDGDFILVQRNTWEKEVTDTYLAKETEEIKRAWGVHGAYNGCADYGHNSPNSRLLMTVGVAGLLERAVKFSEKEGLSEKQKDFYNSCIISLRALIVYIKRLADAIEPHNRENAEALRNISKGAPQNIYEALQLIIAYFFFHEYVGKTRVRTLGRLDVLLEPFYKNDIEKGTFTKEEIREMLKFFLHKFSAAKVSYDLPFCLGGMDADGAEVTSEISYLIVEAYNELNIHNPKIHIRVSDKTPKDFVKLVLGCIRGGNSSFVFINDYVGIKSLMGIGTDERDARDFVPIGCYEPAVWGMEMGCTCNGEVNLAKAIELVVTDGIDLRTGEPCGVKCGKIQSYEDFVNAVKKQLRFMVDTAICYINAIEKHYDKINPDPILSSMYDHSIESGVDVYEGGAKYNNSSLFFCCIASLADSVCAVKKLVFEDKDVSFDKLCEILKNNWEGYEKLRLKAQRMCEKFGNNFDDVDSIAVNFSDYVAEITNNRPNGRGGVFRAALFSIDHYVRYGKETMATPDGRFCGDILSKNLCASVGMDKKGITALIGSVTKIDLSKFPNGSVLDILLHPSAVQDEDGLEAFYAILLTYFKKGGFAMHGNVFSPEDLKAAQKNPEKYANLQVRVCGWNAYFVNLSKDEQDAFIRQAESVV